MIATISADIVDSTALSSQGIMKLREGISSFFNDMEHLVPGSWGRLTRGDFIECVIPDASEALRIALMLKARIKSISYGEFINDDSALLTYGARIAIGLGSMRIVDRQNDIMDGEAIYLSGRQIDKKEAYNKGTLYLCTSLPSKYLCLSAVCVLTDALFNKMTSKQANVIYYKLLNMKVDEIASLIGIKQSTVSQHSTQAGWYAVDAALEAFKHSI